MADTYYINLSVTWDQSDWVADLSPEARLCWVCLLCDLKAVGRSGEMPMPNVKRFTAFHDVSRVAFEEMICAAERDGAIRIEGKTLRVVNWSTYNPTSTERVRKWRERQKQLDFEPDETLHSVSQRTKQPEQNRTEQNRGERRSESQQQAASAKPRFARPTLEELTREFDSKGYNGKARDMAERFLAHYDTVGWVVGKSKLPMRDWQAAVRTWAKREPPPPPRETRIVQEAT